MRAVLLAVILLGAGCIGADGGGACPGDVQPPAREGRSVEVQVANGMDEATCARVFFDGVLVGARELQGEHPALHNNPVTVGELAWDAARVRVRVEESHSGRAHEETVLLEPGKTWVAVWIGKTGFTVRTFDAEPAYM